MRDFTMEMESRVDPESQATKTALKLSGFILLASGVYQTVPLPLAAGCEGVLQYFSVMQPEAEWLQDVLAKATWVKASITAALSETQLLVSFGGIDSGHTGLKVTIKRDGQVRSAQRL